MRDDHAPSLWRPLPVSAVLLLAANDHLLKGSGLLPSWLTGKLSDVAGLFFFPVLLAAVLARLPLPVRARPAQIAAALATAAVFSAVKLVPAAHGWIEAVWGTMAMDPSDLLALPAVALAVVWMRRAPRAVPGRAGERVALLAAAAASMATTQAPPPMPPPGTPNNWDGHQRPMTWAAFCATAGPLDVVLRPDRARVTLPLTSDGAGCDSTLGVTLEYDASTTHTRVDVRQPTEPVAVHGTAQVEARVGLPLPATCAGLTAYATTSAYRRGPGAPPGTEPGAVGRLPLSIGACREEAASAPVEVIP